MAKTLAQRLTEYEAAETACLQAQSIATGDDKKLVRAELREIRMELKEIRRQIANESRGLQRTQAEF